MVTKSDISLVPLACTFLSHPYPRTLEVRASGFTWQELGYTYSSTGGQEEGIFPGLWSRRTAQEKGKKKTDSWGKLRQMKKDNLVLYKET
jgi:hypothetical protein